MRVDDPQGDYTGRRPKSIRDFENCDAVYWRRKVAGLAESLRWPSEP
jgi:hypothetical protein